jgi:hypothetical protein|mmetsp:Transcript_13318/g.27582  ORF Transcript_13318/g.27582 Transcript_13318/m.27582 type:complete len:410 (-) Transcript_13318:71-1300(-)|eukprot:CAMPEP_0197261976 /NCGR_PEP_ID=MMETSP1432-20130617/252_1 /TAXON_ID=44447 /ORGANISM="Pseudo-nitzschia delicatissima, Strain UNC1205" /LENGTH=409 /DNA_ID=CAMNT_0042726273 /DNA_START=99 /DNA_END=1328 /DNA_ORIENTATION=-
MGKKKSKKSKKSKKEEIVHDDYDSDAGEEIDINVPESEDEADDDDGYMEREPDESEGVDFEDKDIIEDTEATEAKKSLFKVPTLSFTQAEMPLLGYLLASFVFFLAAVGKQCKGFGRRRVEDLFQDLMDSIMDEVVQDTFEDFDSYGYSFAGIGGCLRTGYYAYAICLGIFGILFSVGLVGWIKYNASLAANRNPMDLEGSPVDDGESFTNEDKTVSELFLDNNKWLFDGFLLVWAIVGWAVFTFWAGSVFAVTGNGFFALWAMMLFSVWNMGVNADTITSQAKKSEPWIYATTLGSIITIIELTARYTWKYHPQKEIASYGLSVAVVSIVFGLVIFTFSMIGNEDRKLDPKIRLWTLATLIVLWLVAACLTTFIGPFTITGNGYFAVWGCTIASGLAFASVQSEIQEM